MKVNALIRAVSVWCMERSILHPVDLGLSCALAGIAFSSQGILERDAMERESQVAFSNIQGAFARSMVVVDALEGFFAASDEVTHAEFVAFGTRLLDADHGIASFSWAPNLAPGSFHEFSEWLRGQTSDSLQPFTLSSDRSRRDVSSDSSMLPLAFFLPRRGNEDAFGLDLSRRYISAEVIRTARARRTSLGTPPLQLVQDPAGTLSVVIYRPIFSPEQRPPHHGVVTEADGFRGVVTIVIRPAPMLSLAFGTSIRPRGRVEVDDVGMVGGPTEAPVVVARLERSASDWIFHSTAPNPSSSSVGAPKNEDGAFLHAQEFAFADRRWLVRTSLPDGYGDQPRWALTAAVFLLASTGFWMRRSVANQNTDIRAEQIKRKAAEDLNTQLAADNEQKKRMSLLLEDAVARERTAREAAERATRVKDEFLRILSHELRTPMTPIIGWISMLRGGLTSPAELSKVLDIIDRNAQNQLRLINDLLEMSRLLAGQIDIVASPISLARVVNDAIEIVGLAASTRAIRIERRLGNHAEATVMGDADRLRQLAWNVVSNAVKYSNRGGTVVVSVERVESSVSLVVEDDGIGIEPAFLPHVFDRFRVADSTTTRESGGLGIGLALVKSLAELHGGSVSIHSEGLGKGTRLNCLLPASPILPEYDDQVENESTLPNPINLHGARILVVDDIADTLATVAAAFRASGARVEQAIDAEQALECLRTLSFDLVVSDIGLPRVDGLALIRMLRSRVDGPNARTPALALTAFAGSKAFADCISAGFQAHLAKPCDVRILLRTAAALLDAPSRSKNGEAKRLL